MEEETKPYLP